MSELGREKLFLFLRNISIRLRERRVCMIATCMEHVLYNTHKASLPSPGCCPPHDRNVLAGEQYLDQYRQDLSSGLP
jgi:hypothetical protein